MKKFITKFWGVALIVVLLSSFLVVAPASAADPLKWEAKLDAPSALFSVLAPGTNVVDYAISGGTMYVVTGAAPGVGTTAVYQTFFGGAMWTNISARILAADVPTADYVAIAPDDPNIVIVAANTTPAGIGIDISVNGGLTFTSMGVIQDATFTNRAANIRGIDISPVISGGVRYVVAYGLSNGAKAAVYYYNYGSGVGAWKDACADFTGTVNAVPDPITGGGVLEDCLAFRFSPSFAGDYMGVAVMSDNGTRALEYHQVSFNANGNWDTEAGYPAMLYDGGGVLTYNHVSLALSPDYVGSEDDTRIGFVGLDVLDVAAVVNGVWRAMDSSVSQIYGATSVDQISSVAFDGTNLVAGAADTNNVLRSANALSSTPSFLSARQYKRIGIVDGTDNVIVKFADGILYGGKSGVSSCLSKSTDYGNTWNDFSFIDDNSLAVAAGITDIYMTATGDPWYVATDDTVTANLYRMSMGGLSRVLCVATGVNNSIRGLASDANVLYVGDVGGADIYYSADGGVSRWFKRTSPVVIGDYAVDSATTILVGDAATPNVYKSTNNGFTWNTGVTSTLIAGVVSMSALGNGAVVCGGAWGDVAWTADSGTTWSASYAAPGSLTANALVAASGVTATDYIFIADSGNASVWRCPATPFSTWENISHPIAGADVNTGIAYVNGMLYTSSYVGGGATTSYLDRNSWATAPRGLPAFFWGTEYVDTARDFADVDTLAITAVNNVITVYQINTVVATGITVYYFQDTLAMAAPALAGPAEGALVQLTSALMGTAQSVTLTWNAMSMETRYTVQVASDPLFTLAVTGFPRNVFATGPSSSTLIASGVLNPGQTYYWRVAANLPFSSGFSETRSFVVQPTAASVPNISSPEVGMTIDNVHPAFSWTPVSGATKYKFELSKGISFVILTYETEATVAGAQLPAATDLERGATYFWRVKALEPVESDWSTVANFVVAEETVVVTPEAPVVTTTVINVPTPTYQTVTVPPATVEEVNPAYIWAIIIIGAVLVIAVVVLIVRTRRSV